MHLQIGGEVTRVRILRGSSVELALVLAPSQLDDDGFARMHAAYQKRSGADTIALAGDLSYTSAVALTAADVPEEVRAGPPGEPVAARVSRDGHDYLVVGGDGPDGSRYAFFFALDQIDDGLRELRAVLVVGWVLVVMMAAAVGHLIAVRTLRPVREAAEAAAALAGGLLNTRLLSQAEDEFGAWADSFNEMADALEARVDELRRSADRERQLIADVAHDLRTPLTGMAATAQLLEDRLDDLPVTARRAATVIVRDVERLHELVLDLLELSRLDARADLVRAELLDVRAALVTVVDGLRLAEETVLRVDVEEGLVVTAERARFRRIVGNIVANAGVHGGRHVTIAARRDGDQVAITIRDDGPGVDPERAEQIFDRFYKGDSARAGGGSGLGLAIAREHARAHGGDVEVDPGPGRGAAFTVRLPAGEAAGAA